MSFFNAMFREMMMDPFMGGGGGGGGCSAGMGMPMARMVRMMDSMVVQVGWIKTYFTELKVARLGKTFFILSFYSNFIFFLSSNKVFKERLFLCSNSYTSYFIYNDVCYLGPDGSAAEQHGHEPQQQHEHETHATKHEVHPPK